MTRQAHTPDLSILPSVDRVLSDARIAALTDRCDRRFLAGVVRASIAALREAVLGGHQPAASSDLLDLIVGDVDRRLSRALTPRLVPVINATGIVLHT
ncbi:MAG: L-seryl-tRNA(Sec) selenium transferase, partial [bacterium]|nr:L-seryl-tRNA(Sec) selenium transferase [bacterium]